MATIVTRSGKGSPLTNNEVDANFTNLNTELGTKANTSSLATVATTGAYADLTGKPTIASADGSVVVTGTTNIDLSVAVAGSTSNVVLPIRNTTGATLAKGTAVYISGATGQISTVSKAIATGDATSAQTLGLVTANIANNSNGNVTLIGTITNIDTSAYTDGQQLYLSPTTAGTLTATKPYAPQHLVYVAVVEHAHPSQGKLFVKVQNGYEMDELHNVSAQSPANNDGLFYNTSTSLWEKKSIATALGFTPYNATNPAGYITGITSGNVTTALGYTPANRAGDTFTGPITVNSGANQAILGSDGAIELTRGAGGAYIDFKDSTAEDFDVRLQASGNQLNISAAGGLTLNGAGVLTGITSGQVTTALGYTPYNATNPAGYITSSALSGYLPLTGGSLNVGGVSNTHQFNYNESGGEFQLIDSTGAGPILLDNVSGLARLYKVGSGAMSIGTTGANYLQFITNSSERLRIDDSGNVLINRSSTSGIGKLNVEGGVDVTSGNVTVQAGYGIAWRGDQSRIMTPDDNSYGALIRWGATGGCRLFESTTERLRIDGTGSVTAFVDVRAPIFYDSNDTAYYINPNSSGTSAVFAGDIHINDTTWGADKALRFREGASDTYGGFIKYTAGDSLELGTRNNSTTDTRAIYISRGANWAGSDGSFRAPIFYDSNDTAYYVDPYSGTNLRGSIVLHDSGGASPLLDIRAASSSPWALRLYRADLGGGAQMYARSASEWYHSATITAASSMRAPIFYDEDNTAYYTDPASTSNLNNLTLNTGPVYRSDWTTRFQSGSDFTSGTLVTTDIPATGFAGASFIIEITGKSYSATNLPFKVVAQGYLYNDTIINYTGISYGGDFATYIKVFEEGGVLKFWWPRISYWNSFNVNVMAMDGPTNNTITRNRVTAIGNSTEPTGTKKQQINLVTFLRSTGNAATATKANDLNQARYVNNDFNTLGTSPQVFRAYSNYIPSGGSYNQPPNGAGDYKVLQWGDVEGGTSGNWGGQIVQNFYDDRMWFRRSYATTWQAWREFIHDGNYTSFAMPIGSSATNSVDVRAPTFYDSNDTAYYVNPNGGSRLLSLSIYVGQEATGAANSSVDGLVMRGNYNSNTWAHKFHKFDNGSGVPLYLSATVGEGVWTARQGWGSGLPYISQVFGSFGADSVYSPIFYDSADTGFFWNPATTSAHRLQTPSGYLDIGPMNTGFCHFQTDRARFYFAQEAQFDGGIYDYAGNWLFVDGEGRHNSSLRAPIFYDSNNTGYYVDPNSTSNLVGLTVSNTITGSISGNAATVSSITNITGLGRNSFSAGVVDGLTSTNFRTTMFGNAVGTWNIATSRWNSVPTAFSGLGPYGTAIAWSGADTHAFLALNYNSAGAKIGGGSADNINWSADLLHSANYTSYAMPIGSSATNSVDVRAPIFYDSNNTAYFIDPTASQSIRTVGDWRSDSSAWTGEFNGKIQYHANHWYFQSAGQWIFRKSDGQTAFEAYQNGTAIAYGDMRSPLFYDNNNTGYYADPNGTSRMGTINSDLLRSYTNVFTDQNHGYGLVGVYSSYRYQGVFAMGDSYKLPADGTTTGSLYGICWSHPNAGGVAGNLNSHGALFLENGSFLAAVSGSIRSRDDMRSPIFYDSNNTGYYADLNSGLRTGGITADAISSLTNVTANGYLMVGNGQASSDIYMLDSDEGTRRIHCNSNRIGFLTQGEGWGSFCSDNGDWTTEATGYAASSFRAPIFYDSNDTAWYVNPNSDSNLNTLRIRASGISLGSGNSRQLEINNAGSGACNISFHREGAYGAHFGLDTDNWFSTYGWSAGGGYTAMRVGSFYAYGSITATDNVTAYSDIRIKANVETIPNALDKLDQIRGVTFTRIDLDDKEQRYAGVIAQEIEAVLPEAVRNFGDIKAVDYNATIGLLIQAVKELRDEVEMLKK